VKKVYEETAVDPWFLAEMKFLIDLEKELEGVSLPELDRERMLELKRNGFSDIRLAALLHCEESEVRNYRRTLGIIPSYLSVDTCAAEFEAHTPYLYSTYEQGDDAPPTDKKKIIILGSGPNRIGQGIEFDYCCVHAVLALREDGYEAIMVNCNPETVSTDYDISDRLYFEPLTLESVLEIVEREKPVGVIVQFGGQTPLKLASDLEAEGVPIIGTSVQSIDDAEDREKFTEIVKSLGLQQPKYATARSLDEALEAAGQIGFPLMIRPSFVLGGRAMRVVFSTDDLVQYMADSVDVSHERPVLLDRFLHNAIEIDVDAVCDGEQVIVSGVMEHIERAGIHSGDSSCCLPPQSLSHDVISELRRQTDMLARALCVKGLMNVQFAVSRDEEIYIIEVNPRASRTVPFVSKATGIPWAKVASRVMAGKTLKEQGVGNPPKLNYSCVKACVFPFRRFAGVDTILGPEMKSTGEVMGISKMFSGSFGKAQFAASNNLPNSGKVFVSVMDDDKPGLLRVARRLVKLGYQICGTAGTANYLGEQGIDVEVVNKVREGSPHVVDMLGAGEIQLVINTPEGQGTYLDSKSIRLVANELEVPTFTTISAAEAVSKALEKIQTDEIWNVTALQDFHKLVQ
jgi:carbamoyl-phosphate synthase large subunit